LVEGEGLFALLSLYADSAPACEEDEVFGVGVVLEDLEDVEFVVVGLDVGLVEGGTVGGVRVAVDVEEGGLREVLVDRHAAF
jgi:hypothetical protein